MGALIDLDGRAVRSLSRSEFYRELLKALRMAHENGDMTTADYIDQLKRRMAEIREVKID